MAAFHARPSILLRPKKAPGSTMNNSQHLEMEHAREEARLAAKREQRQQREHVRGQQLWGDASDKAELAAQNRADHDAQREARRRLADAERAQQQQLSQQMQQREAETRRAEMAKIEAKREYLARLREDNLRVRVRLFDTSARPASAAASPVWRHMT